MANIDLRQHKKHDKGGHKQARLYNVCTLPEQSWWIFTGHPPRQLTQDWEIARILMIQAWTRWSIAYPVLYASPWRRHGNSGLVRGRGIKFRPIRRGGWPGNVWDGLEMFGMGWNLGLVWNDIKFRPSLEWHGNVGLVMVVWKCRPSYGGMEK